MSRTRSQYVKEIGTQIRREVERVQRRAGHVWTGARFACRHAGRHPQVLVGSDRLTLHELARYQPYIPVAAFERKLGECLELLLAGGSNDIGDYLEFGVSFGTSLGCAFRVLRRHGLNNTRLFGFDSFEGLPASTARDDDVWKPGRFKADIALVRKLLALQGISASDATLIKGWFADTLSPATAQTLGIRRAGIVMVDCDLYASTVEALAFCAPLLGDTTLFIFDDWHSGGLADQGLGERRAFDEFMEAHPELAARTVGSYSADSVMILVTTRATQE
jgi:macrocin-O-methyltransferase TylF-like protien